MSRGREDVAKTSCSHFSWGNTELNTLSRYQHCYQMNRVGLDKPTQYCLFSTLLVVKTVV